MITEHTIIGRNILLNNKKATILPHQGWADFYSSNGLINYYSKIYEDLTILVSDASRKEMIEQMFSQTPRISCIIAPTYIGRKTSLDTCIICHTNHGDKICPRVGTTPCRFVDYSLFSNNEYDNIKLGCFKNFEKWSLIRDRSNSFSHAFYEFELVDIRNRIDSFNISSVPQVQKPDGRYKVIHYDRERGIVIPEEILLKDRLQQIQLNNTSKIMIDQIEILENAEELHFIDSNYSVMIYFLSFMNEKIAKIPKFLHAYTRFGRDTGIYREPVPPNWYFL